MKIRVRAFASLSYFLGYEGVELELPDTSTVKDALEAVSEMLGPTFRERVLGQRGLSKGIRILLNGRDIDFLEGLETKLKDGYEILIFPPAGGG
ncbi:MAG: molybdopterin synthase sulfur carrier subunit [Thermoprotei archaeon]|nr:MAG: molybdopterin synthase sulfur carrier subunit [Thermoprotei archaeon]RLE88300.1 MAG: molybdopterin synthase sulfur carrier subunit [Thermoprotei archaeon]